MPHIDEHFGRTIDEIFAWASAFPLGRTTYDLFAGYWPKNTDPNDPVAGPLNALPKFVASRTRTAFDWRGTEHLPDVVQGVVAAQTAPSPARCRYTELGAGAER